MKTSSSACSQSKHPPPISTSAEPPNRLEPFADKACGWPHGQLCNKLLHNCDHRSTANCPPSCWTIARCMEEPGGDGSRLRAAGSPLTASQGLASSGRRRGVGWTSCGGLNYYGTTTDRAAASASCSSFATKATRSSTCCAADAPDHVRTTNGRRKVVIRNWHPVPSKRARHTPAKGRK